MTDKPNFCKDCTHFNKLDTACDHPKNVKRVVDYDLVTGDLLQKQTVYRSDSMASISRAGETSDNNCGFQGGWYEQKNLAELALTTLS